MTQARNELLLWKRRAERYVPTSNSGEAEAEGGRPDQLGLLLRIVFARSFASSRAPTSAGAGGGAVRQARAATLAAARRGFKMLRNRVRLRSRVKAIGNKDSGGGREDDVGPGGA